MSENELLVTLGAPRKRSLGGVQRVHSCKSQGTATLWDDCGDVDNLATLAAAVADAVGAFAFRVPGGISELEYKGPILSEVRGTSALWSVGMEDLTNLAGGLALPDEGSLWQIGSGDRKFVAKKLAEATRPPESHGFIHASDMKGLISGSVNIFRNGD